MDGGGSFHEISEEDLTGGLKYGNVPFGTITTLDESPLKFGLIYVGTDDGFVHVSENGKYLDGMFWIATRIVGKQSSSI